MSYKNINGLMRHLRESGIDIAGSRHKRLLQNTGYFHGYKGYRFFGFSANRLPFHSYDEVIATIHYDSCLKELFYGKVMFIEMAVKNIALESILEYTGSESIRAMFDYAVTSYRSSPNNWSEEQKRRSQQNFLRLEGIVQTSLSRAYNINSPKIAHFYQSEKHSGVPLWALFDILTLGDFGFLLSCLNFEVRSIISLRIGLSTSADTEYHLVYKYLYALKDLRNAIAHNDVVFDARFRNIEFTRAMKRCLELEVGLPYINFKSIDDYLILTCYFLKKLNITKTEIKALINSFENTVQLYNSSVNNDVFSRVVRYNLSDRLEILREYL